MNTHEAEAIYQKLFVAFPGLRSWLAGTEHAKDTYKVWCGVLGGVEASDADAVVDAMIAGDEPMPEAYERERTPQMIRAAASRLRSERRERNRMHKYHMTATEARTVDQKFIVAIRESRRLGVMLAAGEISKAQNAVMVDALVEWSERGGPTPDWMES